MLLIKSRWKESLHIFVNVTQLAWTVNVALDWQSGLDVFSV